MGRVFERIDPALAQWVGRQSMFFVGTAPDGDGHINVSPKGPIGSLAITGPRQLAYLDIVGSGAETAAHLAENGRIVVMLCSFGKRPRIVRFHGSGRVVWAEQRQEYAEWLARGAFTEPGVVDLQRSIVVIDAERISDSCGYGVPVMDFVAERDNAQRWARGKVAGGDAGLTAYKAAKNTASIDGLPAWPGAGSGSG